MWKFFKTKDWFLWSWGGSLIIISMLYLQVKVDVAINSWFGSFYDMIQTALSSPNSITMTQYWGGLASFGKLAALWVTLGLLGTFFTSHFLFRWRTSMVDYYHNFYSKVSHIEGASQRVQEDTIRFSRIVESLGVSLIEAFMVLFEFFPILLILGAGLPIMFFGDWSYGLATGALLWAVLGTIILVVTGYLLRLVGIEYDIQKREAAYRKVLVHYEDGRIVRPKELSELFDYVRSIHFKSYIQYLKFNVVRMAYLQANVLTAYIFLAPAIVGGTITLGVMQQIVRAFGRVEGSMQFILKAWPQVISLLSVYKRLREFEKEIDK